MKNLYTKWMVIAIMLLALSGVSSVTSAQNADVESYQRSRNEYVFHLKIDNRSEIAKLTQMVSIDGFDGEYLRCFASQREFDRLKAAGYTPILIDNRPDRATYPMYNGNGTYKYDSYPTYAAYTALLDTYANNEKCTLIDLGWTNTNQKHKILGVRINNGNTEGKPKVLWTSTIHGNEVIGTVCMMQLIDTLINSNTPEIQELVNNLDIFIFPNTNPDGTYYGSEKNVDNSRRYNSSGYDLNRNFPCWDGQDPEYADPIQTETQLMMNLAEQYQFTLAVNYHSGGAVVNYPWDCSDVDHADRNWWEYISSQYVSTARQGNADYMRSADNVGDCTSGYINGYDWYPICGGRQDYMNYYQGCREVTIEIYQNGEINTQQSGSQNTTYLPKQTAIIRQIVNLNKNATLQLMHEALNGIHGQITDAITGEAIPNATISIANHDINNSEVHSDEDGYYHRLIKGGSYTVTFAATGYITQNITVNVQDGQATTRNVALQPNYAGITPDFEASATETAFGTSIEFNDLSQGYDISSWSWSFPGGVPETSTHPHPTVTYPTEGVYNVTLTVSNESGVSETLTKENYITVNNHINMHNGSYVVCETPMLFFDSGGENNDYSCEEATVFTFFPCRDHAYVKAEFSSFDVENYYDMLTIYDSPNQGGILVGDFMGDNAPTTITATNPQGALTFVFYSDEEDAYAGWSAIVSCLFDEVYTIDFADNITGGTIVANQETAYEGELITLTATPNDNSQLQSLYYTIDGGQPIDIDMRTMQFNMPAGNVVINATFEVLPIQTIVNMQNGNCRTRNTLFYDSGGENRSYNNRETLTYTFYPAIEGGKMKVEFLSFETEARYDKLYVYDGESTRATLLGTYSGNTIPNTILATSDNGALTFKFTSDASVTRSGWEALVTCVSYRAYDINIDENIANGTITADKERAFAGETVTLTASPDANHFLAEWNVTATVFGETVDIEVIDNQFEMPEGNVIVSARFPEGIYHEACYELINSELDLRAGEKYIIVSAASGNALAMSKQKVTAVSGLYNYFRTSVPVTIVDNKIQQTEGLTELTLEGSEDSWSFWDPEKAGYIYCYRYKYHNTYYYGLNTSPTVTTGKDMKITFVSGAARLRTNDFIKDLGFDGTSQYKMYSTTDNKRVYLFKRVEGYWEEVGGAKNITSVNEAEVNARLYPNPTTGNLIIEAEGMNHISVFNLMGQMVYDMDVNADNMTLDMSQLNTAGMYLVRINTVNGVKTERVTVTK